MTTSFISVSAPTTSATVKVWHVTSAEVAAEIAKEGFKHPSIDTAEGLWERQEAALRKQVVRPIFLAPSANFRYGDVAIEVELELDHNVSTAAGDTGLGWATFQDHTFPAHMYRTGEYHMWPGAKYRILRVVPAFEYTREWGAKTYISAKEHSTEVLRSYPEQGLWVAEDLPWERLHDGIYVNVDVGEWAVAWWIEDHRTN